MALSSLSTSFGYIAHPELHEEHGGIARDYRETSDQDSIVEKYRFIGGVSVIARWDQGSTYRLLSELAREWPEVVTISLKLVRGEELGEPEKRWLNELAEATGWSVNDVVEELSNLDADPSERVERYKQLFEQYLDEALRLKEAEDTRQAAEKLWGAALALIKLYASIKGVAVIHWSRGRIERFITNNVERRIRSDFRNLIDKASTLHEHFYEDFLDKRTFDERWEEALEQLERVRRVVYEALAKATTNREALV